MSSRMLIFCLRVMSMLCREEELLAQGISPKALKVEGGDATREGEERESVQGGQMKTEELTLELPPLGDEKLSSSAQPKRTSSSSTRSTTTRPNHPPPDVVTSPPPIAVPIVTHPAGNGSDGESAGSYMPMIHT